MPKDIADPATQLNAWLTTMHAGNESAVNADTLLPAPGTQQPLLKSFSSKNKGSSAAPVQVGATLAEGGMGVVKFAEQKALGRTVVIKTMREDYALSSAEHILREAWATGALEHPNIVPVHDVRVSEEGAPMIVLKRIEGDTWTQLMQDEERLRESFGAQDALTWNLNILAQVCQALRFAHSRGILHRDLKPDNVMIGAFGEVYLVDWGIALSLTEDVTSPLPSASDPGGMAGTPCYMAPEMLTGEALDARTDIYLLGGLLCEILTGQPPHRTTNLADLMDDIRSSTPELPEDTPPALAAIARKAMAANPEDRFEDASALASRLQLFEQTRGSQLLADEAESRLQELLSCLAAEEIDQQEVYRLFGAVRFGYETAVEAWQDNERALADLDRARVAMIDYELEQRHPQAAQALFQDLTNPAAELGERITRALAGRKKEEEELARYRDDSDLSLGRHTRIALTMILGSLWAALPLAKHFVFASTKASYAQLSALSAVFTLVALGLLYWARESMTRTEINRRISRLLLVIFPGHFLLYAGSYMMGLPTQTTEVFIMFVWTLVAIAGVATVEFRFWPLVLTFGCAFFYSIEHPEDRYLAMAASNLAFIVVGLLVWKGPTKASLGFYPKTED